MSIRAEQKSKPLFKVIKAILLLAKCIRISRRADVEKMQKN
jgi:hypothetical protein